MIISVDTPLTLQTEHDPVVLRQLTVEDAPAYFAAIDANREHLSQFGDETATKYPDLQSVTDSIANPANPEKVRMGIWDGDTFVGSANLTPDEDGQATELGYWLDARYTGRGYATLATKALSSYAKTLYPRVYAEVVDGNDKSAGVLERSGFIQTAQNAGRLIFEHIDFTPPLFPHLYGREQEVKPGEYKLIQGNDNPANIRTDQLYLITEGKQLYLDPLPGVSSRGVYNEGGIGSSTSQMEQVVSFLYHKLGDNGELETEERAIIFRGIGYGVHRGHTGQEPSWYLVGPQIGTIDHVTGEPLTMPESNVVIPAKHFSIACIVDGPLGSPVLANPQS